jgi:hypothetical protein
MPRPHRVIFWNVGTCLQLAHRVNLWRRSNSVAFGAKRTFSEQRLPNRIYEYAP